MSRSIAHQLCFLLIVVSYKIKRQEDDMVIELAKEDAGDGFLTMEDVQNHAE